MNGISKLLGTDGFITVNKKLIRELGLHEAIILGELCSEYNYWEECGKLDNDMFYSTRDNIEYNTGLNEHYQRKAMTTLKDRGILEVKKRGVPAVNYYKIDFDKLLTILSTSASRDEEQDVNPVNLNNNKQTKIEKQKVISKDITTDFPFGKKKSTKPKKENLFTKCVNLIDSYDFSAWGDIRKLLLDYLQFRISVKDKPLYTNMWKGMLNKLAELGGDDITLYESIIKQSIERGYLSFYPVSSYSKNSHDIRVGKPWEEGLSCATYTEEEKREIERQREEMEARGERVWY